MEDANTDLLTPHQVATRLRVTLGALTDWRYRRVGPTYVKVGKLCRYPAAALDAWLASRTVETELPTDVHGVAEQ